MTFAQPVSVTKNTDYVASYRTTVGLYSATPSGLADPLNRDPLVTTGNAGAYSYADAFPGATSSTSYLVDPVFDRLDPVISIAGQDPVPGAVDVSRDDPVKVWFSSAIRSGASLVVTAGGQAVTGSTTLSSDGRTLTFTPASRLPGGSTVSVTLSGVTSVAGASSARRRGATPPRARWTTHRRPCSGRWCRPRRAPTTPPPSSSGCPFTPSIDGKVTAIRFYKGAGNDGSHVGSLWDAAGTKLATVTFTNESPTGWQSARLATPVRLSEGQTYVVSYLAPQGHYASTPSFFSSAYTSGDLTSAAGANGLYLYGAAGGFPVHTYQATNYFVDVSFVPDTPTISVTSRSPTNGETGVDPAVSVNITFSKPIGSGYAMGLKIGTTSVAGVTSLSSDGTTLTFNPTGTLPSGTTVTATVSGVVSTHGAVLADQSWSFQTAAAPAETLFSGLTPAVASTNDPAAVEVGTAFTPTVNGKVTAIRFYKGSGNTGTHVGHLWTGAGVQLAAVTFTQETATGWQTATLSSPVSLTAGQRYVVSYLAPKGHYSHTQNFFSKTWTAGDLTAPAGSNGVYVYGASGGFPTASYKATNYFADVSFVPGG